MRKVLFVAVLAASVAALVAATANSRGPDWFKTSQGPMIDAVAPGATYEPIISVGDTLPGGYMFESIPDGIAIGKGATGIVELYVNHETSTVPFPYNGTTGVGFNDFTNSLVSKLWLHQKTGGVQAGLVRDPVQRELSALLLELPRDEGARLQAAAVLHERGGHRLGEQDR